jgi:hypothetical protein
MMRWVRYWGGLGLAVMVTVTLQVVNGQLAAGLFGLLLLMVFPLVTGQAVLEGADRRWPSMGRIHVVSLILGYGLMLIVTARSTLQWQGALAFMTLPLQLIGWAVAVGLTWAGLGAVQWKALRLSRLGWVLLGITLLALVPRLLRLGTALRYLPDEWIFILGIQNINLEQTLLLTLVSFFATSTWVFTIVQAIVSDLAGGGVFGLRLTSAIIGALTVGAVGWLADESERLRARPSQAGVPIGIVSAVLMAAFPMHINYSRLALYNILDPLLGVLAAVFILRGVRLGSRSAFVSGGLFLGLTAYFYEAGRLMFPAVFGVWLLWLLLRYRRTVWRGLLLTVAAALMIGVPPWVITVASGSAAPSRLQSGLDDNATVFSGDDLAALGESVLMITTTPDSEIFPYYGTNQGIVPVIALPFVVLGLGLVLARPFAVDHMLLLLWAGATLAGNSLLSYQATPRYVILTPVLALLAARGLVHAMLIFPNIRLRRLGFRVVLLGAAIIGPTHYLLQTVPEMNARRDVRVASFGFYDFEDSFVPAGAITGGNTGGCHRGSASEPCQRGPCTQDGAVL